MMLGYLVVTSVLVVSFGRLGDMYGRVKLYNLGFLIFTIASILLSIDWMDGRAGATYLIGFRVVQGIGGAFIAANSGAILTDAFPATQRGFALGINNVSSIAGRFLGLVVGGLLATISWRLVFFVSVPFGIFGTVWAYLKLEERGIRKRAPIDWWGNVTFGVGLILVMVAITAGIRPYRRARHGLDQSQGPGRPGASAWSSWPSSSWSKPGCRTPCSTCTCSRSGPSPSGPCRASWPPWPGAG